MRTLSPASPTSSATPAPPTRGVLAVAVCAMALLPAGSAQADSGGPSAPTSTAGDVTATTVPIAAEVPGLLTPRHR